MIIFGVRTSAFKVVDGYTYDCNHCQSTSSVNLLFASRYFHLFWIPVFPIGKTGISQCNHCKHALYRNEMPAVIGMEYNKARSGSRTPVKLFTGLLLVVAFFTFATYAAFTSRANSGQWIKDPHTGDVYDVKEEEGYTLYKVAAVSKDSVTLLPHEYVVDRSTQLRKLRRNNPDDYDEGEQFNVARHELQALYDSRVIRDVNR